MSGIILRPSNSHSLETIVFTDDTVMTAAVADALMNGEEADDFIDSMKKYGRMYPHAGYGGRFGAWLHPDSREPYNSWGNGSAMWGKQELTHL